MATDLTDNELISNALGSDQSAYRHILERYQDLVFSVARQLMPSDADAEDLAQEAFLKAFRSLEKFEGRSKFSTWLYTIVHNTGLSKLRKKRLQTESIDRDENTIEVADDSSFDGYSSFKSEQRKEFIASCMQDLQEVDRLILTLFYFEDQSLQEIAEVCDMTVNTVKVKLHRARKRLEKKLSLLLKDELRDIA